MFGWTKCSTAVAGDPEDGDDAPPPQLVATAATSADEPSRIPGVLVTGEASVRSVAAKARSVSR
jgi:hypothetical protein